MRNVILALAAVVGVTASVWTVGVARAEDKKEVKLTGTLVCGKCTLKTTEKCSNALQVKEGDKLVNYLLDDQGAKESYHEGVCGGDKVEGVTVTGTVTEKDGKKFIKPTKVETKK
jgi:Family of unknown function (DUF6370)